MKVCYFGIYKPTYTRSASFIKGLKENGVELLECNTREPSNKKYWQLIKKHWQIRNDYQVMIVGFPGHTIMPLAWFLAKIHRKKIIFDAFISLYDSIILDRAKFSRFSLPALKYWLIDWLSCQLADKVLLDANEHIEYFIKTFKISPKKFERILVSCDDSVIYPVEKTDHHDYFLVHFHGTYIPIQGVKYIIEAAGILRDENIKFNIIGRLGDYQPMIEKSSELGLKNINFLDFMPYTDLVRQLAEADVCLGMFGETAKAFRCGAFKITEAIAMAKPLITGNTPAMREFLTDRESCLFCKMANSEDLAVKILELKNDNQLRDFIAKNAYQVYLNYLTPKAIGKDLIDIINFLDNKS